MRQSTEFKEAGQHSQRADRPVIGLPPVRPTNRSQTMQCDKKTFNHIKNCEWSTCYDGSSWKLVKSKKREIDPKMESWSANACVDFVQHMLRLKPD